MTPLRLAPHDAPVVNVDPELRLIAAIIGRAWRDLKKGVPRHAGDARDYFNSPNFEADCAWFNLNPAHARRLVSETFNMKPILSDEQVLAIHAEYINGGRTLAALAAAHNVAEGTLRRAFKRAGLRLRRRHNAGAPPAAVEGDLNHLLAALAAAGHTIARVTIIDLAGEEKQQS